MTEALVLEGRFIVERALELGVIPTTIYATPNTASKLPTVPEATELRVTDTATLDDIAGYRFHRGCIGIVEQRLAVPDLGTCLRSLTHTTSLPPLAIALDQIADPANVGSIIRTCSALGVKHLIMNSSCANPWQRRVIRTSMANVFALRPCVVDDLSSTLHRIRDETSAVIAAGHVDKTSVNLANYKRPRRPLVLVLGNEGHGCSADVLHACDVKLKIAVRDVADSLNVGVAAGILIDRLQWASDLQSLPKSP